MHSIKVFVAGVIIIIGFLGIVTFFLPSKVTVSKSILINSAEVEITNEIENLENWKNWYPGFQSQKIAVTLIQKSDSSFVTLTDEKQRKLSMVLLKPGPGKLDILLFAEGKNNVTWQFILLPGQGGQTQLTWNINTTFPWYPWKKIGGIVLDKVTGPQYQEILRNLKMAVELHQKDSSR